MATESHTNNFSLLAALPSLLRQVGVKRIFASSGSRSMPVVATLEASKAFSITPIVDERVAAFAALGYSAARSAEPVAIVCTSGSALLNYGPALAEAFYAHLPIIVISADRPANRIDIGDGQTMHQPGALANVVASEIDVDNSPITARSTCLEIADMICGISRPVHINIHLSEPLAPAIPSDMILTDSIWYEPFSIAQPEDEMKVATPVLIFVGPHIQDQQFQKAIKAISRKRKAFVVADVTSGLHDDNIVTDVDTWLDASPPLPATLITFGGTPVSRRFKEWLREAVSFQHIAAVANESEWPDTYNHLCRTIVGSDASLARFLLNTLKADASIDSYRKCAERAKEAKRAALKRLPWSDVKAMEMISAAVPTGIAVHCSNGMSVRNANLFDWSHCHSFRANRGINGIEGSTSSALGSTLANRRRLTLLLSGDMSALYDVGALFSGLVDRNFRMVVFDNSGGEIFRIIDATRSVSCRESLISGMPRTNWQAIAAAVGLECYVADSANTLCRALNSFFLPSRSSKMLIIKTTKGNSVAYKRIVKCITGKQ